jgi:hypothetical protein
VVAIPPVVPDAAVALEPPPAETSPTPSVTTPTPDTAFTIPNTVFIISQTGVPLQEVARTPSVHISRNVQTQETFETSDAASSQSDAEGNVQTSLSASDDVKPLYRTIMHGLLRIHPALKARLGLSDDFIKSL